MKGMEGLLIGIGNMSLFLVRYEWQGKIQEDSEVLLMIKTRSSKVASLAEYVRSNHPYEVAEVISLPIEQGNPPYLKWLDDAVPE
nr:protein CutA homolog [Oncorhynchus nerka]